MKNNKIIIAIVVCVVVAGLSFWGGIKYNQSKNKVNSFTERQGQFGQNIPGNNLRGGMRGTGGGAGGAVVGEVLSIDEGSLTVKLPGGGSKIVFFSPTTDVKKMVNGEISDIIVGKQVVVTGSSNPDGSISSKSIDLRGTLEMPLKN